MILEEMYNGRFYPCETVVADSPRFKQAVKASAALMDTLSERLSKEDYALVEELREQVAIAQCEENESHFKYGFSAGAACSAGSPCTGIAERQRIASSIVTVPKLGTTTTTEYSFTKAICQSIGGWLFCRFRIWKFYFRLRLALRLGGMGLAFPLILLELLSCLDRLSIRRNAEKSSEEIFSKGICNLSQNSWISISVALPES